MREFSRWLPPAEPEKPPVPYKTGHKFTARRVQPPPPLFGKYAAFLSQRYREFTLQARSVPGDLLYHTTLVNLILKFSATPLPCDDLDQTDTFEIHDEIAVGDGPDRGGGSQVFTCTTQRRADVRVAKVFDPLYYPFADYEFPHIPNNAIERAEGDFTVESAAYTQLDKRLGGRLIPKFHGSWLIDMPLKGQTRSVGLVLMELVHGFALRDLDPKAYTHEQRLRVLAMAIEAEIELHHAGVLHWDVTPRNVIVSSRNFDDSDLSVRIIDFNHVDVFACLGEVAPCEKSEPPESPVDWFWNDRHVNMRKWVPEHWGDDEFNNWLWETWGGSKRFKAVDRPEG